MGGPDIAISQKIVTQIRFIVFFIQKKTISSVAVIQSRSREALWTFGCEMQRAWIHEKDSFKSANYLMKLEQCVGKNVLSWGENVDGLSRNYLTCKKPRETAQNFLY